MSVRKIADLNVAMDICQIQITFVLTVENHGVVQWNIHQIYVSPTRYVVLAWNILLHLGQNAKSVVQMKGYFQVLVQ